MVRRPLGGRLAAAAISIPGAALTALEAERDRWALWTPVCFGAGVAVYFGLKAEPPWWVAAVAFGMSMATMIALRRWSLGLVLGLAVVLAASGFWRAQIQTDRMSAPVLLKRTGPATVTGRVVRLETMERGHRMLLDEVTISRLAPRATPARVRVRAQRAVVGIRPGDTVRLRAILLPPPAPAAPGAYDFARRAYFARLGAVGFVLGGVSKEADAPNGSGGAAIFVQRLRRAATERILGGLDPPPGAVAAALITGERGAIPKDVLAAMRDAGLAHLLAISGLHMGLVAGILFFGLRLLLAAVEPLALRHPIKKWAAVGALAGAACYLLISGATVPTQRAFLMVSVALLAVLFDRNAISMRLVAWAALVVLLIAPESLLGASFQLSFAAVVALVAFYEAVQPRLARARGRRHPVRRAVLYLATVVMTTVVAGLATAPLAIIHFDRFAVYGVAANLVAIPLTGFWIMPWAIVALVLMPFGLEGLALAPMGWGIEGVIAVARTVAAWPGSVRLLAAPPPAMLGLVALGGLWLCLWRSRWRYAGALALVGGIALVGAARPPDVLVDGESGLMAVRLEDGRYALSSSTRASFRAKTWLRRAGQAAAADWPAHGLSPGGRFGCDPLGCVYEAHGRRVVLARHRAALAEDCAGGGVVITLAPVWWRHCRAARRLIGPYELWRDGPHAIWLEDEDARVEHVRAATGHRPWTMSWRRAQRRGGRGRRLNSALAARRDGPGP